MKKNQDKKKLKVINIDQEISRLFRLVSLFKRSRRSVGGLIAFLIIAIIIFGSFFIFHRTYAGRIYPNVYIGNAAIGGKDIDEATKIINEKLNRSADHINFIIEGKPYEVHFVDLGIGYDIQETLKKSYKVGRSGILSFFSLPAFIIPHHVTATYEASQTQVDYLLGDLLERFEIKPEDAKFLVSGKDINIQDEKNGETFDRNTVRDKFLENIRDINFNDFEIKLRVVLPEISKKDLETLLPDANKYLRSPLSIKVKGEEAKVEPNDFISGLGVNKRKNLIFTSEYANKLITDLEKKYNKEPIDAKITIKEGKVEIAEDGKDGEVINKDKAAKLLTALPGKGKHELEISFEAAKPTVSRESVDKLKLGELAFRGESDFSGSPANRIHNIKTAAAIFNDILIQPGEEFSFIKTLGDVSAKTGYLPEMVIKQDRTVPEYGGGICQVSTTLFRAAYTAGFPIIARTAHAYRVSYYEPAGFDATVYIPTPDLVFKNDTKNYFLIQAWVDGNKLYFDLYGNKEDRRVEIIGPTIISTSPPPAPRIIKNDKLAPGEKNQLDTAHPGAKTVLSRKIFEGDKQISEDSVTSSYIPWPAKFEVGPDKEEEKTPEGDEKKKDETTPDQGKSDSNSPAIPDQDVNNPPAAPQGTNNPAGSGDQPSPGSPQINNTISNNI